MRKTVFTEEQVAYTLRQVESRTPVAEVCRKLGISEQTLYRWKKQFAGMLVFELRRRLRQLKDKHRQLNQLVADLTLDTPSAAGGAAKNTVKPAQQRDCARLLQAGVQVSERRACRVIGSRRSGSRYRSWATESHRPDGAAPAHPCDHRGAGALRVSSHPYVAAS